MNPPAWSAGELDRRSPGRRRIGGWLGGSRLGDGVPGPETRGEPPHPVSPCPDRSTRLRRAALLQAQLRVRRRRDRRICGRRFDFRSVRFRRPPLRCGGGFGIFLENLHGRVLEGDFAVLDPSQRPAQGGHPLRVVLRRLFQLAPDLRRQDRGDGPLPGRDGDWRMSGLIGIAPPAHRGVFGAAKLSGESEVASSPSRKQCTSPKAF